VGASLRCLSYAAVAVGVFSSAAGLRLRSAPLWGAAGLAVGLPFAALTVAGDPAGAVLLAIPAVAVGLAVAQWR
jgi:hypothetical protein